MKKTSKPTAHLSVDEATNHPLQQPCDRLTDIKLIRLSEVIKKTGFKKSWIYLLISQGEFPSSVKIGSRSVAWIESEINEWIVSRINKREELLK